MNHRQVRVVVADDVQEMVDAVANQLEPAYTVVGRVSNGVALVECVRELAPDLLVTDISMPKLTGIEALRSLRQLGVQVPAIIFTVCEDADVVREALSLPVQGFILKKRLVSDLLLAVHEVLEGRTFISEPLGAKVFTSRAAKGLEGATDVVRLEGGILLDRFGMFIARSEAMEWQASGISGIQRKLLFVDEKQQSATSLVRMQAGMHFPTHQHGGSEEVFMLRGDLVVEGQRMEPGDYCRAEMGTIHNESYTVSGCLFLLKASQQDKIIG